MWRLFAVLVVVVFGFNFFYVYGTADTSTILVTEKERIVTGSGDTTSSKYLVFTKHNDVFENTDSWLRLKFNSSTVQGKLKVGEAHTVKHYGWRVPFLSWYPNIIEIET